MKEWGWNGARWWKCDFHTHTPASNDYGKGQSQTALQERSPKEWLLDYMRAGVDCIAITDHNTGAWIDVLRNAMEELIEDGHSDYRKLYIFSGMEISISGGIHLLAIFDPSKTSSDLDALRGAVEYGGTPGQSDDVTRKAFVDVINTVTSAGGIAIPAHVDEESGLFHRQKGNTLDQALNCKNIFAMELVDPASEKPQLYIDKGLRWAEILGSDSHHPSGVAGQSYPGSHFTWVKMGSPSVEGLRLALLDGELSVRRVRPGIRMTQTNTHRWCWILLRFRKRATWVAPKSSLLGSTHGSTLSSEAEAQVNRLLSSSFVLPFDGRLNCRRRCNREFEQYNRVYQDREDSGLLTEDAAIRVICRKDSDRFRVQWNKAGGLKPIEQEVNG